MKFFAKTKDVASIEADLLAVFAFIGKGRESVRLSDEAQKIDGKLDGIITDAISSEEFEAKREEGIRFHTYGKIPAKTVLVVGLGTVADLTVFDWQTAVAVIGKKSQSAAAKRIAIAPPHEVIEAFGPDACAEGVAEGMLLGTYTFHKHKGDASKSNKRSFDEAYVLVSAARINAVAVGLKRGKTVGSAVCFVRDLVNESPSTTTPSYLGLVAKELVKGKAAMKCEEFARSEIRKLGMEGLLGIARGSEEEPRFIRLDYNGGGQKTIVLVGKGITFDAGGLSLKPSKSMETMKLDMAGAASILGIFQALPVLRPKAHVVGLIAACENMPSGRAIKPGDIVRMMSGKTVEILNTDAEGRVVLADALSFAAKNIHKPDAIIDIATLTGACVAALGEEISGLFTDNEKLAQRLGDAARATGEKIWRLPLAREYKELLKSDVADIKNISGSRYGGAISAALFLQEFVPEGVAWAHLDIAGPVYAEKAAPLTPKGATGTGVRMILKYLLSL